MGGSFQIAHCKTKTCAGQSHTHLYECINITPAVKSCYSPYFLDKHVWGHRIVICARSSNDSGGARVEVRALWLQSLTLSHLVRKTHTIQSQYPQQPRRPREALQKQNNIKQKQKHRTTTRQAFHPGALLSLPDLPLLAPGRRASRLPGPPSRGARPGFLPALPRSWPFAPGQVVRSGRVPSSRILYLLFGFHGDT